MIVATGGGTFVDPDNRATMLADGAVAWLDVPLERVIERVPADGRRPLAADRDADGTALRAPAGRLQPGARPHRCVAAGARNRRAHPGVDWVLKYLVISDIHANLEALDAVLTAAGRYDHVLVLGDFVGYGADPNAVIDRVRALPAATFIRGNHDKVGAGLENTDGFNYLARHAISWTANALTPDHRQWLAALPQGPVVIDDLVEICHGAPFDEDVYIFDDLDAMRALRVAQASALPLRPHPRRRRAFTSTGEMRTVGALHAAQIDIPPDADSRFLVNCGAVGQPRDGDPRAAYGILDTETRTLSLQRIEYDVRGRTGEDSRGRTARCARAAPGGWTMTNSAIPTSNMTRCAVGARHWRLVVSAHRGGCSSGRSRECDESKPAHCRACTSPSTVSRHTNRSMTDASGRFELHNLAPGPYTVKAELPDYVMEAKDVAVARGSDRERRFRAPSRVSRRRARTSTAGFDGDSRRRRPCSTSASPPSPSRIAGSSTTSASSASITRRPC